MSRARPARASVLRAGPPVFHRRKRVDTRQLPGGNEAEHHRRDERDRRGDEDRGEIDRHAVDARHSAGASATNPLNAHDATSRPSTPPADREHRAFGHELPGQLAGARTERLPDRDLLASSCRPREDEMRDVDARDQQEQADAPQQHEHRRRHTADDVVLQRLDPRSPAVLERDSPTGTAGSPSAP